MREQFLESGRFLLGQWKKFLIVLGDVYKRQEQDY